MVEVLLVELAGVAALVPVEAGVEGRDLVRLVRDEGAAEEVVAEGAALGGVCRDGCCEAVLRGGVCGDECEDLCGVLDGEDGVVEVLVALAVPPLVELAAAGPVVAGRQVVELARVGEVRPVSGVCEEHAVCALRAGCADKVDVAEHVLAVLDEVAVDPPRARVHRPVLPHLCLYVARIKVPTELLERLHLIVTIITNNRFIPIIVINVVGIIIIVNVAVSVIIVIDILGIVIINTLYFATILIVILIVIFAVIFVLKSFINSGDDIRRV